MKVVFELVEDFEDPNRISTYLILCFNTKAELNDFLRSVPDAICDDYTIDPYLYNVSFPLKY
jgi:hypothetical protein